LKKQIILKPGYNFIGSRAEAKRFQAHGSTGFSLYAAPHLDDDAARVRVVALQVAFERRILKAVFHLVGYRLWV
jgi:hypothetical protein